MRDLESLRGDNYILWGANSSLYSAKLRPFLIKKCVNFVEINPSHPHFKQRVLSQIGHFTIPVLECPDGHIVADSTEAMEYLDPLFPQPPMLPGSSILAALAQLIHSYGSEGLHKPAMYWRWNTSYVNRRFIIDEFSRFSELRADRDAAEVREGEHKADYFRNYLPPLGINLSNDVDCAIETSTEMLYDVLNAHFLDYPYVLGGLPCMADYGLMGPFYAHLGRDPASAEKLKLRAPALYRWIETMGRSQLLEPELWQVSPSFFDVQTLPETLIHLLRLICADFGPEVLATADLYHQWLEAEDRPAGTVIAHDQAKSNHQLLGPISHPQQGATINRMAMLDCLTQHQRFVAQVGAMDAEERSNFDSLMDRVGGTELAGLRLNRRMVRKDFVYVLA